MEVNIRLIMFYMLNLNLLLSIHICTMMHLFKVEYVYI